MFCLSKFKNRSERCIHRPKKTLLRNRFLVNRVWLSEIARQKSPKKTLKADRRIGQSEAFLARQVHRTVESVASKKKRQGSLLVQSDPSGRTTSRTHRHTDKLFCLDQSKAFGPSFKRSPRQHLRLVQSKTFGASFGKSPRTTFVSANNILLTDHPLDRLSYQSITSFGWIILWTDFCIVQSHPSDGSYFTRTFVSTNQNILDKPSRESSHLNGHGPHE